MAGVLLLSVSRESTPSFDFPLVSVGDFGQFLHILFPPLHLWFLGPMSFVGWFVILIESVGVCVCDRVFSF